MMINAPIPVAAMAERAEARKSVGFTLDRCSSLCLVKCERTEANDCTCGVARRRTEFTRSDLLSIIIVAPRRLFEPVFNVGFESG